MIEPFESLNERGWRINGIFEVRRVQLIRVLSLLFMSLLLLHVMNTKPASGQTFTASSFNPGLGQLVGIGFDPVPGNVFIYSSGNSSIYEFTPTGSMVSPPIPRPGASSSNFDLDFLSEHVNIGGTVVPPNSLLVINGADSPATIRGLNKDNGAILATVGISAPGLPVGGSYHDGRNTIFIVNTSDVILEINPATGGVINSFSAVPSGSPAFDVSFGDVEVNQSTGNLYVVGSSQNRIRELTLTGGFVQDIDVGSLGISGMSGIAIDDATGDIYICTADGTVYRASGLIELPGFVADLSVTKDDSDDPVTIGNNLTYTITVTNNGPDGATGVMVVDTLPSEVTFVSATTGCLESSSVVTCDVGEIANGTGVIIEITVSPTSAAEDAGIITNTVEVAANEADPDPNNNIDTEDTAVNEADQCPDDPEKTEPGLCGCGVPDTDSDGDATPDCNDECPDDPDKIEPGECGCGLADTDGDGDGTPDCSDDCPADPDKIAPGACGCGTADTDGDGDGTPDCNDFCSADPNKVNPGVCGCGVSDTDGDGDGTPDCNDACISDPNKTAPGICGCGIPDTDSDGDGTADCADLCPVDSNKINPGECGCGVADTDSDGDGIADCNDACPNDAQNDSDGDGVCGDVDNCPEDFNPGQEDSDGDGIGDACDDGFQFTGFFSPVDNPPTFNLVKAGSAVPVKFSLNGDQGLNIFEVGYPKSQAIACDASSPLDTVEETVTAGSSSLSYDPSTDQYTYVWKTNKSWGGKCRQLIVEFIDGSYYTANFKFKK